MYLLFKMGNSLVNIKKKFDQYPYIFLSRLGFCFWNTNFNKPQVKTLNRYACVIYNTCKTTLTPPEIIIQIMFMVYFFYCILNEISTKILLYIHTANRLEIKI